MQYEEILKELGCSGEEIARILGSPELSAVLQNPAVREMLENPAFRRQMMQDIAAPSAPETEEPPFSEALAAYQPEPENDADRAFAAVLKAWAAQAVAEIPADDVCMLQIGYEATFDREDRVCYTVWLAYNTERTRRANRERFGCEVWNCIDWTDDMFRTVPQEPFAAWRDAMGFDENNDGDNMIGRIYDLAAAAVSALHAEKLTEQRFGRRVPFVIGGIEPDRDTALRTVKANGSAALLDAVFFAECGLGPEEIPE